MSKQQDQSRASNSTLNWLRAAVLGANDGIVSVAAIVLGVAGATSSRGAIFTAGMAGLVAGALSMASGEYVSVSSQRDTERAYIDKEKQRLSSDAHHELSGLTEVYRTKGLSEETALRVAEELTARDPLKAHLEVELQLNEDDLNNPWQAAWASLISFTLGGLIPLVVILLLTSGLRVPITFVAVLVALCLTGYVSASVGGAPKGRAILRNVIGGGLAMAVTYGIGHAFGHAIS